MPTSLADIFTSDANGLIGSGLATGNLSPSSFSEGNSQVWILSANTPQPRMARGKWIDSSNWADTNVWYD